MNTARNLLAILPAILLVACAMGPEGEGLSTTSGKADVGDPAAGILVERTESTTRVTLDAANSEALHAALGGTGEPLLVDVSSFRIECPHERTCFVELDRSAASYSIGYFERAVEVPRYPSSPAAERLFDAMTGALELHDGATTTRHISLSDGSMSVEIGASRNNFPASIFSASVVIIFPEVMTPP